MDSPAHVALGYYNYVPLSCHHHLISESAFDSKNSVTFFRFVILCIISHTFLNDLRKQSVEDYNEITYLSEELLPRC